MIDERFSASEFATRGLNTKQSLELANALANEVLEDLHSTIACRLLEIIEGLNAMGHNLKLYGEASPGDISYHDATEDEFGNHCKLRVAVDTVISTGYSHFDIARPSNDEEIDWLDPNSWPDKEKGSDR